MSGKPQCPPHGEEERQGREKLNALIGGGVIRGLGTPDGMLLVQVRYLWDDHYRVNVLVGPDVVSAKVAHSFFLEADGEGNVIASVPTITKQY